MTALRQDVVNMVSHVPEKELFNLFLYLRKITEKNIVNNDIYVKDKAYTELLKMIKPIENLDEERELEEYRLERYGI